MHQGDEEFVRGMFLRHQQCVTAVYEVGSELKAPGSPEQRRHAFVLHLISSGKSRRMSLKTCDGKTYTECR